MLIVTGTVASVVSLLVSETVRACPRSPVRVTVPVVAPPASPIVTGARRTLNAGCGSLSVTASEALPAL